MISSDSGPEDRERLLGKYEIRFGSIVPYILSKTKEGIQSLADQNQSNVHAKFDQQKPFGAPTPALLSDISGVLCVLQKEGRTSSSP